MLRMPLDGGLLARRAEVAQPQLPTTFARSDSLLHLPPILQIAESPFFIAIVTDVIRSLLVRRLYF
jgi:hypothetical protein